MDFDPSTPPKKHNVFLPIILSFVLVLGIWLGYFLSKRIHSGSSSMSQNYHGATNDKINRNRWGFVFFIQRLFQI